MNTQVNLQSIEDARQEWLQSRRLGIGGSDVAAILGLSKYSSPYQLWLDKTGRSELEDSTSEPAYWGNMLEDIVAKEYAKRNGVKVQRVNATIAHPEHDWMRANIDRAIINPEISGNVRIKDGKLTTDRILECKTANQYLAKLWGDEQSEQVPDYYLTQVQWYMGITGAPMPCVMCSQMCLKAWQLLKRKRIKKSISHLLHRKPVQRRQIADHHH